MKKKATISRLVPRLFDENGVPLAIASRIGRGGEGDVYSLSADGSRVAKIYHKHSPDRLLKLRSMLNSAPADPFRLPSNHLSFSWPEQLVFAEDKTFAGFLMPRVEIGTHQPVALYWNAEDRGRIAQGFTWKHLMTAGANIASLVEVVHASGHVVGDLNEENLLVNDQALVTVVDCDSMQIRDLQSGVLFRNTVARPAYISPERLGVSLADCDRHAEDDFWALAVLLFQILLEGQHPSDGIGGPEERGERIRQGIFPVLGHQGIEPPKYALSIEILPVELHRMFERCFRDGHSDPSLRPTASEWHGALNRAAASLIMCPDQELHFYNGHLQACPWCAERDRWGIDRFASERVGAGPQIELSTSRQQSDSQTRASATTIPSYSARLRAMGSRPLGVLALCAAVIALLVALTPMFKTHPEAPLPPNTQIAPAPIDPPVPIPAPPIPSVPPVVSPTRKPYTVPRVQVAVQEKKMPVLRDPQTTHADPPAVAFVPTQTPPSDATAVQKSAVEDILAGVVNTPPPMRQDPEPPPPVSPDLHGLASHLTLPNPRPVSVAPQHGTLIWSGSLAKNVPVVIANGSVSAGLLRGDLFPGVPIVIDGLSPAGLAVAEPPSPFNGFRRLVLRSNFSRSQVITISWHTP